MIISCAETERWRRIDLYIMLPLENFDVDKFVSTLGARTGTTRWTIGEVGQPFHSHAKLQTVRGSELKPLPGTPENSEPPEDFYSLEISLYRVPYEEHDEQEALISHEVFLSALVSAAVELEEVDVTANVQQYYSAENTKWRISLLANPPEFGEFDSELGTVSVAGVGLRFSDSQVGLLSAALDISPFGDEYRCALTFFHTVRLEQIDALFSSVLKSANEFSSMFVSEK